MMKTKRVIAQKTKLLIALIVILAIFLTVAVIVGKQTYKDRYDAEKFEDLDMYSMHGFSETNSNAFFTALKAGDSQAIKKLMVSEENLEAVLTYADWSSMDEESIVSLGSGSLSAAANKDGLMDMGERFFVDTADGKYVFYIETLTSRWGRVNDGISAVGVTTYDYFDAVDYEWLGEAGDDSACAGELFWPKNQGTYSQGDN